ncbi:peptide ABC transporter substrate-binding protein [Levilactobacillus suantsaii]|uniref:peptide ABC transporter substrate-binding protein n=1 Tax=Levilactobacillus suantsaii TaxID=2292255 RepID=UPI001F408368|nr:peptide ABC transporter substrate-binding protein [Levilactobacillus suantsaii]
MLQNTQEGLYRLGKNGKPLKAIATHTKLTNGGKTYTIDLRHDAKWSNGDPVTAQNFVYSWRRTLTPKTAAQMQDYLYPVVNAKEIFAGKKAPSTLGITAHGPYKLTIQLTKPVSYWKTLLAWPVFYPENPKIVQKYGNRYGTSSSRVVSDGPYQLTKWNGTSKTWTLAKNPHYWNKANVHLTAINYQVNESTATSYNLFMSKRADETLLSGQQVKNNLNNPNFVKRLPTGTQRLDMNQKKVPALKHLVIRQALSAAINRDQLVKNVLQDGSVASTGLVPVGMGKNPKTGEDFSHEAIVKSATSYDLTRAKRLLAQGYHELHTKHLDLTLSVGNTDATKQTAEFIQSSLEKLPGVKIAVRAIPYVQLMTQQEQGNFELTLSGAQSVLADPNEYLGNYVGGTTDDNENITGFNNARYNRLMTQADNVDGNNPTLRWQKLIAAEKTLMTQQAVIPLFQQAKSQLLRTTVKGIIYNPAGIPFDFTHAYMAQD